MGKAHLFEQSSCSYQVMPLTTQPLPPSGKGMTRAPSTDSLLKEGGVLACVQVFQQSTYNCGNLATSDHHQVKYIYFLAQYICIFSCSQPKQRYPPTYIHISVDSFY